MRLRGRYLPLLVSVLAFAVACGGAADRARWESDLAALLCSQNETDHGSGSTVIYARPPFLVETLLAHRKLDLSEDEPRTTGAVGCDDSPIGTSISVDDIRFLGALPETAGEDVRFVAIAERGESRQLGWVGIRDSLLLESEGSPGRPVDWSEVPALVSSTTPLGRPDLETTLEPSSLGAFDPGRPCVGGSPSSPGITLRRPFLVRVTSRGPSAVAGVRLIVNGVLFALRFRRPMEPFESFSFHAPSDAHVAVTGGASRQELTVPPPESVTVACRP